MCVIYIVHVHVTLLHVNLQYQLTVLPCLIIHFVVINTSQFLNFDIYELQSTVQDQYVHWGSPF